jgi:hypothetical protein
MNKYLYNKQYCIDCDNSTALPVGDDGLDGEYGGYSSLWRFSTNTTMADPTAGYVRFNNSTYSSVTTVVISQTNLDGTDMEGFLTSFINSNAYGLIRFFKEYDSNVHWYGRITNVVDNGTYFTLTVTFADSNSAFALNDNIVVSFSANGATGSAGSNGSNGTNGTNGTDGRGYDSTSSVTNLTIGTGSKSLTVTTNKAYIANASRVRIAYDTTNYMEGVVTAYNASTGAMTVTVDRIIGSGTYSAWNVSIVGDVSTYDTGWLDLQGFDHYSGVAKPKYRIYGKTLQFRGSVVIPMTDGAGGTKTYTGGNSYTTNTLKAPGSTVTVNGTYSVVLNNSSSVFQSSSHHPDGTYSTGYIVALRTIESTTAGTYIPMTAMFYVSVNSSGQLVIATVTDQEDFTSPYTGLAGASPLRFLTTKVEANDYALDFRTVNTNDSLHGNDTNAALDYTVAVTAARHNISIDASNADEIGGFGFLLNGLTCMIA